LISISSQHFKQTPSLQTIDLSELKKRMTQYVLYSLYTVSTSAQHPAFSRATRFAIKKVVY
jgi:hypothetical protein